MLSSIAVSRETSTARSRYNAAIFLCITRERHPIARPLRARYGVSFVSTNLTEFLLLLLLCCVLYRIIYDRHISRVYSDNIWLIIWQRYIETSSRCLLVLSVAFTKINLKAPSLCKLLTDFTNGRKQLLKHRTFAVLRSYRYKYMNINILGLYAILELAIGICRYFM